MMFLLCLYKPVLDLYVILQISQLYVIFGCSGTTTFLLPFMDNKFSGNSNGNLQICKIVTIKLKLAN